MTTFDDEWWENFWNGFVLEAIAFFTIWFATSGGKKND
jgi:hypothetical protein